MVVVGSPINDDPTNEAKTVKPARGRLGTGTRVYGLGGRLVQAELPLAPSNSLGVAASQYPDAPFFAVW